MPDTIVTFDASGVIDYSQAEIQFTNPDLLFAKTAPSDWSFTGTLTLDLTAQTFVSSSVALTDTKLGVSYVFDQNPTPYQAAPPEAHAGFEMGFSGPGGQLGFARMGNSPNYGVIPDTLTANWLSLAGGFFSGRDEGDLGVAVPAGGAGGRIFFTPEVTPVATPEPAAWLAMAAALVVAAVARRWRRLFAWA